MSKIVNTQAEMLILKKIVESKSPELLMAVPTELFGNKELQNIYTIIGTHFTTHYQLPGWDVLKMEITNRVANPDKQRFYVDLISDIKAKDTSGITTDDLIKKLHTQYQFRCILDGAGKLVDSVDKRDEDNAVAVMKEMYESMFQHGAGDNLDSGDMVRLAGKSVQYNFRKSGLTSLDMHGPFAEKSLTLVGAPSKAGKSLLALQFLTYGHENYEGSSCYISYEMSQTEVKMRILASKSEINVGLITSNMLTNEQRLALREAEVRHLCDFNPNMKDFIEQTKNEDADKWWPLFWDHFAPKKNRFFIPDKPGSWDKLFLYMQMMVDMKNVRTFVLDYISLVPRGGGDKTLASWEYLLARSRDLKTFARNNDCRIITPVQLDEKEDKIRWGGGIIADCDLCLILKQENGDKEAGTSTVAYKAFRNFQSVPNEPALKPFKLLRRFDVCKFEDLAF